MEGARKVLISYDIIIDLIQLYKLPVNTQYEIIHSYR